MVDESLSDRCNLMSTFKLINLQSVVHSGTCQVTITARDVGVSIRIRGMVQDGYVRDIDNS